MLHDALEKHNRLHGLSLRVASRPDPPDAIITDGELTTWIELTDAFVSPEWAQDLSSNGSIKGHTPMASGGFMDMDMQFAENFCNLLEHKARKQSYAPIVSKLGPGILVIGLESPWLDGETMDDMEKVWMARGAPDISGTFEFVYVRHRAATGAIVLPWPRQS